MRCALAVSNLVGKSISLALLSVVGLASGDGLAQMGPQPDKMIEKMDRDGDGRISRGEWLRRSQGFKRIDRDGDGYATAEELKTFFQKRSSNGSQPGTTEPRAGGGRHPTASATGPDPSTGTAFEIIDTHVHLGFGPKDRDFAAGVSEALTKMPGRHIALAILLPVPQHGSFKNRYDQDDLRRVARSDRFRIAGGSGVFGTYLHTGMSVSDDDRTAFRALAQSLVDQGIVAFGEIGLNHFATPRTGNVFGRIPLDHPLLDVLGDVAAKSGVPIDVHFDVVPRNVGLPKVLQGAGNPDPLEANLAGFERFLERNRKTKIVWAHVGFEVTPFRTPKLCETLLRRHDNLFMSIRLMRGEQRPSVAMDKDGKLKAGWKRVFTSFPDRFVFGSESMYGSPQSRRYDNEFVLYQKLLAQLPAPVARQIASSNARKIYRLGPEN